MRFPSHARRLAVALACSLVLPLSAAQAQCGTAFISGAGTYALDGVFSFSAMVPQCPTPDFPDPGFAFYLSNIAADWSLDGQAAVSRSTAMAFYSADDLGGFALEVQDLFGETFALADYTGPQLYTGTEESPRLESFSSSDMSEFSDPRDPDFQFTRFSIEIHNGTPVPEPASAALLALGLGAMVVARRRRRDIVADRD